MIFPKYLTSRSNLWETDRQTDRQTDRETEKQRESTNKADRK